MARTSKTRDAVEEGSHEEVGAGERDRGRRTDGRTSGRDRHDDGGSVRCASARSEGQLPSSEACQGKERRTRRRTLTREISGRSRNLKMVVDCDFEPRDLAWPSSLCHHRGARPTPRGA